MGVVIFCRIFFGRTHAPINRQNTAMWVIMLIMNANTTNKKKRRSREERKSFFRRIRIPLLTVGGVLLTAFVIIPASFDILGITPVVVEIAEEMVHMPEATPAPTAAVADGEPAEESPYYALKLGDTDPMVARIQERLAELNYIDGDEPSETFGEPVAAALRRFQRIHHMTETGEADPLTQEMLFSEQAAYYRLQQGDEGEDVESLQVRLYELGYEVEKKNGYFGVATTRALTSFQTRNRMEATGIMDTDTADILYSNNARPKVDPTPTPTPKPKATPKPTAKVTAKPETNTGVGTTKTAPPTNNESGGGSVAAATGDVSGFIATAKAQQGKPYVLGDEGPDSFDCSGLVHYCLNANGVKVGRMSAKNYAKIDSWETIYSTGDLQPGDLLFFRSDSSATISHTGIWLGGNKYIHASSSAGKVVISSWSDWANRNFSHGKRVF